MGGGRGGGCAVSRAQIKTATPGTPPVSGPNTHAREHTHPRTHTRTHARTPHAPVAVIQPAPSAGPRRRLLRRSGKWPPSVSLRADRAHPPTRRERVDAPPPHRTPFRRGCKTRTRKESGRSSRRRTTRLSTRSTRYGRKILRSFTTSSSPKRRCGLRLPFSGFRMPKGERQREADPRESGEQRLGKGKLPTDVDVSFFLFSRFSFFSLFSFFLSFPPLFSFLLSLFFLLFLSRAYTFLVRFFNWLAPRGPPVKKRFQKNNNQKSRTDSNDYSVHRFLCATHTSGAEPEFLQIAEVQLPDLAADAEARRFEEDKKGARQSPTQGRSRRAFVRDGVGIREKFFAAGFSAFCGDFLGGRAVRKRRCLRVRYMPLLFQFTFLLCFFFLRRPGFSFSSLFCLVSFLSLDACPKATTAAQNRV
ncbi:MAG: hypothetical protein BJ554DRAFT_2273 [Olpidium bornovanus]|uniref:Histone-binding protein RBBP4-like N-terminal domain-containing protein n=1 Tax=Olpidium bornovanus TaxID=278681 RepID=A0A8H7ZR55_9FUNG|nr:MAG: hypothetical protein BJ554DRAFT_2273 [Olpidium bornovanus]